MAAREWALLILLSFLWGGSFFLSEVALQELGPFTVVLGRVGFAAVALAGYVYFSGGALPAAPGLWAGFLVMGALNNLIPFSLIVWGQVHIEGGLASILNATTPLFTVVLAHVLTGDERMTPNRLAGVLLGLAGVAVLMGPEVLGQLGVAAVAELAVLGAALSYACAAIYGRRFRATPPAVTAAGMVICSAVLALPLALIFERPWDPHAGVAAWSAVLGLALPCTAVAYLIYFRILAVAGATNLMLVTFLIPVSALALGAAFLGERPDWTAFAGMALIFAGLAAIDGRLVARLRPAGSRRPVSRSSPGPE